MQNANKEDDMQSQLPLEKVKEFYQEHTNSLENSVTLDEVIAISKKISLDVEQYRPCNYQSAIAAIALSQNSQFTIVISPTGSGKTWI